MLKMALVKVMTGGILGSRFSAQAKRRKSVDVD
jgi:hypothetical protein